MKLVTVEDVQCFEKLCDQIKNLDSKIRFAGVISEMGKIIAGGSKEGTKLLVDEREHEMLFMEVALRIRMRHEFNRQLGPVNFTISHRDKVVVMSMPFDDKIMYVSADKELNLSKVPFSILEIMRRKDNETKHR